MIRESLPPAGIVRPALPANSELDLERWPRWMRDALAIQPEIEARKKPSVVAEPAGVNRASVRKLTRMPSRS